MGWIPLATGTGKKMVDASIFSQFLAHLTLNFD